MIKGFLKLLDYKYFNNTLLDYLIFISVIITGFIIITIIKKVVIHRVKKLSEGTETTIDDFFITTIERNILPLLYFGILLFSTRYLKISKFIEQGTHVILIILFTFYGIRMLNMLIGYFMTDYMSQKIEDEEKPSIPKGVITLVKVIVWIFGVIFLLDNLGFKISTVIAGLGIGGVAVALAAQAILKDLFSYFVILFDRPFEAGDFIVMDEYMGTVERIGIKTTRIRSTGGEQLIVSNTKLTDSNIRNFKRMKKRTSVLTIGVSCETPIKKLPEIPSIIEKIIKNIDDTTFERAHLKSYGDYTLNYEVLFFINTTDYTRYMDIQQEVHIAILQDFQERGIELPYPTQQVQVKETN